jgi:hypothetical protein
MALFLSISSGPRSVGSHSDIDTSDEEQDYDMEDYDADNIIDQEQPKDFADDDGGHFRQIGYPEHTIAPVYPDHIIAALTRTSSPRRIHPQGPSYVTERARLLRAIDADWHRVLRRFILQDIQEDVSGKNLEHIWAALNTIVIFDFEPGPALLDRLDYHNWDSLNISEQQGLFLESLARNVEWYCPKYLYGSRMREVSPIRDPPPSSFRAYRDL